MDPPHVSLYGLTVEAGTALGRAVAEGREEVAREARYREEFLEAAETLAAAGFRHYEVSNFARPGSESRHNRVYWTGGAYLGLGNGAHSYLHPVRRWNLRDWPAYAAAARDARLPVADEERLDPLAGRLETLWLGLRIREGIELASLTPGGGTGFAGGTGRASRSRRPGASGSPRRDGSSWTGSLWSWTAWGEAPMPPDGGGRPRAGPRLPLDSGD